VHWREIGFFAWQEERMEMVERESVENLYHFRKPESFQCTTKLTTIFGFAIKLTTNFEFTTKLNTIFEFT
jgi:hypothetical protein